MSWAARRQTTRPEDVSYCLLGIFNVNMPLLYGEGAMAFRRLQEEIARSSHDQTLLAWQDGVSDIEQGRIAQGSAIFAEHPGMFDSGHLYRRASSIPQEHTMIISNAGLELDVYLMPFTLVEGPVPWGNDQGDLWLAVLNGSLIDDDFTCVAIIVQRTMQSENSFKPLNWHSLDMTRRLVPVHYGTDVAEFQLMSMNSIIHLSKCASLAGTLVMSSLLTVSTAGKVKYDLEKALKCRIILHEDYERTSVEIPRCLYIFQDELSSGYAIERKYPVSNEPLNASLRGLPLWQYAEHGGSHKDLIYGALSMVNHAERKRLFLIWGLLYPKDRWAHLCYNDAHGWRSENVSPFCKVYADYGTVTKTLTGLEWIRRLGDIAMSEDQRQAILEHEVSLLQPNSSLTWSNVAGDLVTIEAAIKLVEFLGRARFHVEIRWRSKGIAHYHEAGNYSS